MDQLGPDHNAGRTASARFTKFRTPPQRLRGGREPGTGGWPRIPFGGRVLLLGCGSVSQCLQPLLLRHLDMDFTRLTVMDFEDSPSRPRTRWPPARPTCGSGSPRRTSAASSTEHVGDGRPAHQPQPGTSTPATSSSGARTTACSTSTRRSSSGTRTPTSSTTDPAGAHALRPAHEAARARPRRWTADGPTAVVEHGANPGLVSHWTKVALQDIAAAMLAEPDRLPADRPQRREAARGRAGQPRLRRAWRRQTGTKVIHISERDTQITDQPKQVGEFVNTWSVEGFYEEGIAPAELGWGTHEPALPAGAHTHADGPAQPDLPRADRHQHLRALLGAARRPDHRHGRPPRRGVHDQRPPDGVGRTARPVYRPTVHYAYLPTDAAMDSLHECRMRGYELQTDQRIMNDEITSGRDELGVLLLGHDLNGWWVGSQLDIDEARALVPHQNATTLQVAASVLGRGVLDASQPEPGPVRARRPGPRAKCSRWPTRTWARARRCRPTGRRSARRSVRQSGGRPGDEDVWQFASFLTSAADPGVAAPLPDAR